MANTNRMKTYEELEFTDDFLFCKILQSDPDLCKELTELIIGREIGEIVQLNRQHVIEITADSHGVRFDVYLKDDRNTLADIEMQTVSYPELPKRSRYYQSMMDLDVLERGSRYTELPQSYVIFICLENPFREYRKYGLHKYSFRNTCVEDHGLELKDGAERIFLSAEGSAEDVSEKMKSFLSYLVNHTADDELTRRIDDAVQNAKTQREWSVEYMTLYEKLERERETGREEGREEGLAEGREEGLAEGRKQGLAEGLCVLVRDGILTRDEAAKCAENDFGIKREEFLKLCEGMMHKC